MNYTIRLHKIWKHRIKQRTNHLNTGLTEKTSPTTRNSNPIEPIPVIFNMNQPTNVPLLLGKLNKGLKGTTNITRIRHFSTPRTAIWTEKRIPNPQLFKWCIPWWKTTRYRYTQRPGWTRRDFAGNLCYLQTREFRCAIKMVRSRENFEGWSDKRYLPKQLIGNTIPIGRLEFIKNEPQSQHTRTYN